MSLSTPASVSLVPARSAARECFGEALCTIDPYTRRRLGSLLALVVRAHITDTHGDQTLAAFGLEASRGSKGKEVKGPAWL